eukprot:TRINITY_DN1982_c0_g1_i1.p1 TRINITY_DN1982_c0_g1~~TRINITY_DN1982_c0_g1_i1.p1  ORF type:complete len:315 (-),score=21.03 TRINITY_DN1982_c0_g1_i1:598-1542(-)
MSLYDWVTEKLNENEWSYLDPPDFEKDILQKYCTELVPSYGEATRKKLFLLQKDLNFIAHGSYGASSIVSFECTQAWQRHIELQPVDFYYNQLYPLLIDVIRILSKEVGCHPSNLSLVPNVEFGMNAILNSLKFQEGDDVLVTSLTYGAVVSSIQSAIQKTSGKILKAQIPLPLSSNTAVDDIIQSIQSTISSISSNRRIKLAVISHITSPTAIIMPIEEIIKLCHLNNIMVLIDGAHSLGQLDVNLTELGADFYVSNGHKWLCCTRGAGYLYASDEHKNSIRPVVTSWGWNKGFNAEFIWQGTMDYTSMIALR